MRCQCFYSAVMAYSKLDYSFPPANSPDIAQSPPVITQARAMQIIGTLRKERRQRQREPHQTKRFFKKISKTIAVHVRYKTLYISSPYSAKQQRVMNKFCVVWRTGTTTAKYFVFQLNAFVTHSAGASFNTDRHTG